MRQKKMCREGHIFYKSSDCAVCPVCEKKNKSTDNFLSMLSAPARRALQHQNITTLQKLSSFSEKELLQLHGIGNTSIPKIKTALAEKGMHLKE